MHARCVFGYVALGIDERVENIAGRALMNDFDRPDFKQAMSLGRAEAGRFRIEHDFTHSRPCAPRSRRLRA